MPIRPTPSPRPPAGARRAALLARLRADGAALTVADLAQDAGLHPNTVRAHLEQLVRAGDVVRSTRPPSGRGRPRELYAATPDEPQAEGYAALAAVLAAQLEDAPDPAAEGVRAGRRWSAALAAPTAGTPAEVPPDAVGAVDEVLRRAGFAPEPTDEGRRLALHACPFRDVARAHSRVVCNAHLGLIQATLDRAGDGITATLTPFVEPELCVVGLSAARPASA